MSTSDTSRMTLPAGAVVLALTLLSACRALAIAPPYFSDEKLADFPIIVIAQWDKAPVVRHDRQIAWNTVDRIEAHTFLNVLRVIKGSTQPGVQPLIIDWGIAWNEDGKRVMSGTSTDMLGDVSNITTPCLWFLKREHSWDKQDRTDYLSISNYRAVQPLTLEGYFSALGSSDAKKRVPEFLAPGSPEVSLRVLRYICGGIWPWPYDPDQLLDRDENPDKRGELLKAETHRVWQLIASDAGDVRPHAVAVYAELEGKGCIQQMRSLLDDKDPAVRGIAAGILARYRDAASLDGITHAVKGVEEPELACKLIEALSSWSDDHIVPALAVFLENDGSACEIGDDLGIPALKARDALHKITGHWFPFSADASLKAWEQARKYPAVLRGLYLQKMLPGWRCPLKTELVGSPIYGSPIVGADGKPRMSEVLVQTDETHPPERETNATIRLRNVTENPVVVTTRPSAVSMSSPGSCSDCRLDIADERLATKDFITIEPGKTLEYEVKLSEEFLVTDPATRKLQVFYRTLPRGAAGNAWIGIVDVRFGSSWKEQREVKKVEQTWPNGNLKATGTTVNGYKFGEWNDFNEKGDRIRVVDYGGGHGTGDCNPEYPGNKGAGKRSKKE